jgi:beta-lactamase superfamily II metal-dependent hydrolase
MSSHKFYVMLANLIKKDIIFISTDVIQLRKSIIIVLIVVALPLFLTDDDNNQQSFAAPAILINEVELNPLGTDSGQEKVELYNPSDGPVDLGGWTLSSTAGTGAIINISDGAVIPGHGYVLVDSSTQWLDNEQEIIVLRDHTGVTVDYAGYFSDRHNDGNTWQRSPDGSDKWIFALSTLGNANVGLESEGETALPPLPPPTTTIPPLSTGNSNYNNYSAGASEVGTLSNYGELKIVFIDVGQGDSILVLLPNTNTFLIDGGDRQSSDEVLSTLRKLAITEIDAVIATHPHADHIGGLIDVINNLNVSQVIDSGQMHTTQTFEDLLDVVDVAQIPLMSVHEGDSIKLDPRVKLDILNPPASLPKGVNNEEEFNDNSVVLKLTYGEFTALFTGDMEDYNERRLLATTVEALDVDVLKAGHHGSRTSSGSAFLNAVSPEAVVISAGANNTYGHPHPEALDRINNAGVANVLRTDIDGTIIITTTGDGNYTIEAMGSNRIAVVPEFADIAILIAGLSLVLMVAFINRGRIYGRRSH